MEHMTNIGKGLTSTGNNYNKAVGSLEGSFLPQGRKINQLAQSFTKKIFPEITPIEVTTREIVVTPPELSTKVISMADEVANGDENSTI